MTPPAVTPPRFAPVDPMALLPLLPPGSALGEALRTLPTIAVPWDRLADVGGWSVWLGYPPIPTDIDILPLPESLVWGDPVTVLGTTVATALAYASIRGAGSFVGAASILQRESPVTIIVPSDLSPSLAIMIAECTALGIPMIAGADDLPALLWSTVPQRRHRTIAHAALPGVRHDPALSAELVDVVHEAGVNSLSSFILHPEGEQDGVTISGEPGDRFGIEIGILGEGIDLAVSRLIEADAARMPGFLAGITSEQADGSLRIGLAAGRTIDPEQLGAIWQAWLREIWGASLVDVRIAFAPEHGRSALLVDRRTRAQQYRAYRDAELGPGGDWADSGYGGAVS